MVNGKMSVRQPGQPARMSASATAVARSQGRVRPESKARATRGEMVASDGLKSVWREVCRKQKALMVTMIFLILASAVLFIVSMTTLRPQNTVVIVGYSDVYGEIAGISGGYRRASWATMLAFPILAVIYGLLHNLLALRIYRKYGRGAALVFVFVTMLLIVITFVTMLRVTGEW